MLHLHSALLNRLFICISVSLPPTKQFKLFTGQDWKEQLRTDIKGLWKAGKTKEKTQLYLKEFPK